MDEQEPLDRPVAAPREAAARFVVVAQGAVPEARVVEGLEAVKDAVLQAIWREAGQTALEEAAGLAESLDDPEEWARHGTGDGLCYWHWWFGFEGGSVTVQRLTSDPLRAALVECIPALAECGRELRRLGGAADRGGYVFTARRSSAGPRG
jgi:hypothetical protein